MLTSIKITTTDGGKTASKTITYINPQASNSVLAQFGTMLTALTLNTYQKTDRIDTQNCDTALRKELMSNG